MAHKHHQQDSPKREIHRRCPAPENLHNRLSKQNQSQEELVRRRVVKTSANDKNEATAAITVSPKSSSAENAVKCFEGSTGTIVELNLLSGAASAGWNPPDWNAMREY